MTGREQELYEKRHSYKEIRFELRIISLSVVNREKDIQQEKKRKKTQSKNRLVSSFLLFYYRVVQATAFIHASGKRK